MLLTYREVYLVGYRKREIDPWETSGKTYGNLVDATAVSDSMGIATKSITKVFKMGRAQPVEESK